MALTGAERAKNYRDRRKEKKTKYIDFKKKDCERKARKQASLNPDEKEKHFEKHRISQQRYRDKLKKEKDNNTKYSWFKLKYFVYVKIVFLLFSSSYRKQTLAKAVKKVFRALPKNRNRQEQVVRRVGQDLGLFETPKFQRTQAQIPRDVVKKVQEFYGNDSISWQAPGKRDCVTIRENGIRIKYQKRHLLYNIREVHQLFIQEHSGMKKDFNEGNSMIAGIEYSQ
jgi:hypothetical protein